MWIATRDISTIVDVNEDTRQMIAQFIAEEDEYAQANEIIKEALRGREMDNKELVNNSTNTLCIYLYLF